MIYSISGTIKAIKDQAVILDLGSLSLAITVPLSSKFQQDQKISLFTYVHWNQENGPSFFGFEREEEKKVFILIISCSGIGPKIGISILENIGLRGFLEAVSSHNEKLLSKVNGIGPKKAEQIIVSLKHKVGQFIAAQPEISDGTHMHAWTEVSQALESLNYTKIEITQALHHITANTQCEISFEKLLRSALNFLSKK